MAYPKYQLPYLRTDIKPDKIANEVNERLVQINRAFQDIYRMQEGYNGTITISGVATITVVNGLITGVK
jgi:hypothetical protein